jgi:hypothetical protein
MESESVKEHTRGLVKMEFANSATGKTSTEEGKERENPGM